MTDLKDALAANLALIVGPLVLVVIALLVVVALLAQRVTRLRQRVENLTLGEEGQTMQLAFDAHHRRVIRLAEEVEALDRRSTRLEDEGKRAFQRLGFVRFNPFEDTGGNQSFALALLDAEDDGVLISSLHARQMTRIYAKAIGRGVPEAAVSDEEAEALKLARSSTAGRAALEQRTASPRQPGAKAAERTAR